MPRDSKSASDEEVQVSESANLKMQVHLCSQTILTQGGSKVRRPCQSTIMGGACADLRHSDRSLRTA